VQKWAGVGCNRAAPVGEVEQGLPLPLSLSLSLPPSPKPFPQHPPSPKIKAPFSELLLLKGGVGVGRGRGDRAAPVVEDEHGLSRAPVGGAKRVPAPRARRFEFRFEIRNASASRLRRSASVEPDSAVRLPIGIHLRAAAPPRLHHIHDFRGHSSYISISIYKYTYTYIHIYNMILCIDSIASHIYIYIYR
jgi:hypothetical protein